MTESNSVTMVLVEYSVYTNLKKTQEEYRKLVAKNATLKTSSSAQEEVKANSDQKNSRATVIVCPLQSPCQRNLFKRTT